MATSRSYRQSRVLTNLEAQFDGDRQRIAAAQLAAAQAERTAPGIAPLEPSDLIQTFRTRPADAWGMLATLSDAQLVIQAIDTACYLLGQGTDISWSIVLQTWRTKLAAIAEAREAEQEALAIVEGAQAHLDNGHERDARTLRRGAGDAEAGGVRGGRLLPPAHHAGACRARGVPADRSVGCVPRRWAAGGVGNRGHAQQRQRPALTPAIPAAPAPGTTTHERHPGTKRNARRHDLHRRP